MQYTIREYYLQVPAILSNSFIWNIIKQFVECSDRCSNGTLLILNIQKDQLILPKQNDFTIDCLENTSIWSAALRHNCKWKVFFFFIYESVRWHSDKFRINIRTKLLSYCFLGFIQRIRYHHAYLGLESRGTSSRLCRTHLAWCKGIIIHSIMILMFWLAPSISK